MNTQRLLMITTAVLAMLSSPVYADRDDSRHGRDKRHRHHDHGQHYDYRPPQVIYVPVIHVQPVIEYVRVREPRRDCWQSSGATISHGAGSATGTILGGVIGGVIGHDLARGHHEDLGILAGTLLGATVGHDLSHSTHRVVPVTQTHCESYDGGYDEQRIIGYDVTYHYHNRAYVQRTHRHPGSRIQISVNIDD